MQKIHWPSLLKALLTLIAVPLFVFVVFYLLKNYLNFVLRFLTFALGTVALYSLYELYKSGYYDRNDG